MTRLPVGKNRELLRRKRGRRQHPDECERRKPACNGRLRRMLRSARRAQHGGEFAPGGGAARVHLAAFHTSPPMGAERRERTTNSTPTPTMMAESSMGSVRNPSAMTGESASRNCSVE